MPVVTIRDYEPNDEEPWLRCRVLSFLHTAYYDDVLCAKPAYGNQSIELVAFDQAVVGFLDIELESKRGTICYRLPGPGGAIWHLGVHPDHWRRRIAHRLLDEGIRRARAKGITALEAWTRDDTAARSFYESAGFRQVESYWHAYMDEKHFKADIPGLHPIETFAHYLAGDIETIRPHCRRLHECVGYQLEL
jgi:ribosomal protein S18 acetylase RimI-like enzyme